MAKRRFELIKIIADEQSEQLFNPQAFLQNYQTALILSLLERGLLTQWQFDRCIEELKKQKARGSKSITNIDAERSFFYNEGNAK